MLYISISWDIYDPELIHQPYWDTTEREEIAEVDNKLKDIKNSLVEWRLSYVSILKHKFNNVSKVLNPPILTSAICDLVLTPSSAYWIPRPSWLAAQHYEYASTF